MEHGVERLPRRLSAVFSTGAPRDLLLELHTRFFAGRPFSAWMDDRPVDAHELAALLQNAKRSLRVRSTVSTREGQPTWGLDMSIARASGVPPTPSTVCLWGSETPPEVAPVLALLSELDFEVASFGHLYETTSPQQLPADPFDWGTNAVWRNGDLTWVDTPPSFADGHGPHGWACAFRGRGFERLVSRRWLEDGPWKLHRGTNDTCLVQFHDLDIEDGARAREMARPGHELIGITERGGYIQSGYTIQKTHGLFVPETGELKIVVHGRAVSPVEMRDARVLWKLQRLEEKTIRQVTFVFVEEARAREHLPLLFRYELGCAAIIAGSEVRLDV